MYVCDLTRDNTTHKQSEHEKWLKPKRFIAHSNDYTPHKYRVVALADNVSHCATMKTYSYSPKCECN